MFDMTIVHVFMDHFFPLRNSHGHQNNLQLCTWNVLLQKLTVFLVFSSVMLLFFVVFGQIDTYTNIYTSTDTTDFTPLLHMRA